MNLAYSEEDERFRGALRSWLEANIPVEWTAAGFWQRLDEDHSFAIRREWEQAKADAGWAGIDWPTAYGGRGGSSTQRAIYLEEMALADAPPSVNPQIDLFGPVLLRAGTEAQRQRFMRPLLRCDEIWCQGFSEPNAGSDLASLRTAAELQGDRFVVNGQKVWTCMARQADWVFLLVRTDPSAAKHRGISFLLVDMKSPGIDIRPFKQMTGQLEFAEVFFDEVAVPAENLVGELNDGWRLVNSLLAFERQFTGIGFYQRFRSQLDRLLEVSGVDWSGAGRSYDDPVLRQRIADVAVDLELLRLHSYSVVSGIEHGKEPPRAEASVMKVFSSETHQRLGEVFCDVLGMPSQVVSEHLPVAIDDLQFVFLRSRAETISGGTAQIQRTIIGEQGLGLPREPR